MNAIEIVNTLNLKTGLQTVPTIIKENNAVNHDQLALICTSSGFHCGLSFLRSFVIPCRGVRSSTLTSKCNIASLAFLATISIFSPTESHLRWSKAVKWWPKNAYSNMPICRSEWLDMWLGLSQCNVLLGIFIA